MIIGLTGGIGSGKSTVSNIFAELGIDIVDADIVARQVVEPNTDALSQITEKFGRHILLANGELNRSQLRSIVFSHQENKAWLNQLLHPLIRAEMLKQLSASTSPYCLLVAPLLLENGLESFVNRVLVVDVDEETQIARTVKRDSSNSEEIKRIIASQISRPERLAKADDIIENSNVTVAELKPRIHQLHEKYIHLANQPR